MNMIEHRIRERAYFIWENEGRVSGRADAHWLQAETELAGAGAEAPLGVEAPLAEIGPAPSPAETLKPRASRAKASAKPATKVAAKAAPKGKKVARSAEAGAGAFH